MHASEPAVHVPARLLDQALVLLRDNLGLRGGEHLLILGDGTVGPEIVAAARCAAVALGARPIELTFDPETQRPIHEYCRFAGASLLDLPPSLPRAVLAAVAVAERAIFAISDSSIFFSPEVREAASRCPALSLNYLTTEHALRLLPESREEAQALVDLTREVERLVASARRARVTSTAGTDLTLALGQYRVFVQDGAPAPNRAWRQLLPAGQVSRVPDDQSAEGVLVIDRSMCAFDFRELREPVRLTVQRGDVVSIEGGLEAERLRRFLADFDDPAMRHLTELGVGTNRRCRFTGVAFPWEDTHTLGCVSMALGCDVHLGGRVRGSAHIDMTQRFASLELDGRLVVSEGKLLVGNHT